jgi:opacity protein-like surface antigen
MPYVTGGYAQGSFDFDARQTQAGVKAAPVGQLIETAEARLSGWYIGGGVEWAISPGWSAGVEYRHYEFDPRTVTAYDPASTPVGAPLENARFDASTDTVTARVSWRWGRPDAAPLK